MFSFLSKTFGSFFDAIRGIKKLDAESIDLVAKSMHHSLLDADVPIDVAEKFIAKIKERCLECKLKNISPEEYVSKQIYDELLSLFNTHKENRKIDIITNALNTEKNKTIFVAVAGLQGAGKTTSIGKLVKRTLQKNVIKKNEIGVFSLDYYRPAARTQLKILCDQLGVDYYNADYTNVLEAAKELSKKAREDKKRIVFVDTAGRLAIDKEMMEELKNVWNIINPHIGFLVFDIMTGQQGLTIAEEFSKTVSLAGIIITKVDSNAPGGCILGIAQKLNISPLYMAQGEKLDDLIPFDPIRMAKLLLGMGDILTLAETAEKKLNDSDVYVIENAIKRGDINIDDYIAILESIAKIGPLKSIMAAMPASMMGGKSINDDQINQIEHRNKCFMFLKSSMTAKERKFPQLLINNDSRKKRIAKGSGLKVEFVNDLLVQFENSREGMKKMKGMMKMMGKF